jgi:HAD superfamily hydrolase (TIGR01544 family)
MSEQQIQASVELLKHYYPLEIDQSISFDQKFQLMEDWHHASNTVLTTPPFHSSRILEAVERGNLVLRNGIEELLSFAHQQRVPVTIVSGGVGNVIESCLAGLTGAEDVEVLSNYVEFDSEDMAIGFKPPIMHSLSKSSALTTKQLKKNIVLLGDMPHDLHVVAHHDQAHVLSVGFYNDETVLDLPTYSSLYDVLVMGDGNLQAVELILTWICGAASRSLEDLESLRPLLEFRPINRDSP